MRISKKVLSDKPGPVQSACYRPLENYVSMQCSIHLSIIHAVYFPGNVLGYIVNFRVNAILIKCNYNALPKQY